jgi:hypothetical protein
MRRSVTALAVACFALGAAFAFALEAGRSQAQTQQDPVRAFLSSVQHAAPGQFATPQSAIRYLVEQVRTQNVVGATRVLPIAEVYSRTDFPALLQTLESVDINSFFPKQPFSKFVYSAVNPLTRNYTLFTVSLLIPHFLAKGVVATPTQAARQAMIKNLDPARLKGIHVGSIEPFKQYPIKQALKSNRLKAELGVNAEGETTFVVSGLGPDRRFDTTLERIGKNWFVETVGEH